MSVITSYSIHYTKLYDQGFGRAILSQPPVFLSDKEVEAIKASVPKAKSDAIKLSFNRDLYDSIVANEKEGASTEQAIRTTSYNVCYTKLLRVRFGD